MINLRGISKTFVGQGNRNITPLDDISFDIDSGVVIGLTGASGEGKSTLANILCGICAPTKGEVLIDGLSLWNKKGRYDKKRGCAIQLIPQKPALALDPTQTVYSAVKEAVVALGKVKRGEEAKKQTLKLFDEVGLDESLFYRLPTNLSGGEAQRVVIARALATNPKLIVSDESTSMLDKKTQRKILDSYEKLVKTDDISLLFITHDTDLANDFCDTVYTLNKGKLYLTK